MPWINVKPTNSGGGAKKQTPAIRIYESGLVSINHATADMLGNPERVLVQIDPDAQRIRMSPTTPTNNGGFTLTGGGNTPHRITMRLVIKTYPQMIGEYSVIRIAGGIECRKATAHE